MKELQVSQEMQLMQNSIAMTVTLISFAMLFATLFLGYFLVRFNSPVWPPVEIQGMPWGLPLLSTMLIVLSSGTYYLFESKEERKNLNWFLTLALGVSFLVCQWILWGELKRAGILAANGMVPSMVYAFTWMHAGHIVLGVIALVWIGVLKFSNSATLSVFKVTNVGKFWHFLTVIWILMYLMMFVL